MSKTSKCLLLLVATTLLAVGPVLAADSSRAVQVRVIHGVFAAETGEKVAFRVPEGGTVVIKSKDVTYHLIPQILNDGQVQLKLVEPALHAKAAREIAVFDLQVNGKMVSRPLVPFSLGVTSIQPEKVMRAPVLDKAVAIGGSSCCITCGGWQVCCYPASGWCCTLDSSCGNSCTSCNSAE